MAETKSITLSEKDVEAIKDIFNIQAADGNWNHDPYMHGMFNGMEMMLSMIEGREPDFRGPPQQWIEDNSEIHDKEPTAEKGASE